MTTPCPVLTPVGWPDAAHALGLVCPSRAYPQHVSCPVCEGRMVVYQDTATAAAWHHCSGCSRSGDMAVLAGAVWGVDHETAAARLSDAAGVPPGPPLSDAARDRLRRMRALWDEAHSRACLPPVAHLNPLLERFRLQHTLEGARRQNGPASLYGYLDRRTVEEAFQPCLGRGPANHYNQKCVFKGGGWRDVLAVPYFDLPDRVRAFLFVGRAGDPGDFCYEPTRDGVKEFGLAGLPSVSKAGGAWGNAVVAVRDPLLMLRLQTRHLHVSARPLPLVSWYEGLKGVTFKGWESLTSERIVFWCRDLDAATLRQAVLTGGDVAVVGPEQPTEDAMDKYVRAHPALDLFKSAVSRAVPWRDAVDAWAGERGRAALDDLLLDLEATDAHHVLLKVDRSLLADLTGRLVTRPHTSTVRLGEYFVTQQPDGAWTATTYRRGRAQSSMTNLVSSASLRVEEVEVGSPDVCRGVVRFKGEEVPFSAVLSAVKKDPFGFMDRLLMSQGKGVLSFDPTWKGRVVQLAYQFHEPAARLKGAAAGAQPAP